MRFPTAQDEVHGLTSFGALMRQIGEILTLVRGVSDRINLLALKAAIEAERAIESTHELESERQMLFPKRRDN